MKATGVRSIALNAAQLLAARVLTQIVRAVYVVALARYLGPEVYGLFAYGQSWYLVFLPITMLGLGAVMSREVGRDRISGAQVVRHAIALRILSSLAGAIASGLAALLVEADSQARELLIVFSIALAGRALALTAEEIFSAYERSRYILYQELLFRPLEVILGLALLVSGAGVITIAALHAVIWWLQAVRGFYIVRARFAPVRPDFALRALARLVANSITIGLAAIFGTWIYHGPLVLSRHSAETQADLGQIAVAIQALLVLCVLPGAIGRAAAPVVSRAAARRDEKDLQFIEGMLWIGITLGTAAGLSGMAIGPWLTRVLLGSEYVLAGRLLGVTLWMLIPIMAASAVTPVLVARGKFVAPLICAMIGATVMTLLTPLLASAAGAHGVIIAAGTGATVWSIGLYLVIVRSGRIDLIRALLKPGLLAVITVLIYLGAKTVGADAWLALLIALVVLGLGTVKTVIAPEEKRVVFLLIKQLFR